MSGEIKWFILFIFNMRRCIRNMWRRVTGGGGGVTVSLEVGVDVGDWAAVGGSKRKASQSGEVVLTLAELTAVVQQVIAGRGSVGSLEVELGLL